MNVPVPVVNNWNMVNPEKLPRFEMDVPEEDSFKPQVSAVAESASPVKTGSSKTGSSKTAK